MKIRLLLTLFVVAIFTLIILIGCGGGNDGVTQSSSIITPTPDIKNYGYLIFKVKWPENNSSDKLSISCSNKDNEIIASIPVGTVAIKIAVMDENTGIVMTTADGKKAEETISPSITDIKIGPLPPLKVKVGAVSYNSFNVFSKVEKIVQIKPGMVPVDIYLGSQTLLTKAVPPEITLHEELSSSIIAIETPVPLIGEAQIIARLVVESPDIPDATPTQFVPKEDSNANNTLESQGVMGLENFEVKFKIIDGNGTLYPVGSQTSQETVSAYTASDGYCNAILKTTQAGNITVQVSCELIPGDPNSIITRDCSVNAIQPPTPTPTITPTPEPDPTYYYYPNPNIEGRWYWGDRAIDIAFTGTDPNSGLMGICATFEKIYKSDEYKSYGLVVGDGNTIYFPMCKGYIHNDGENFGDQYKGHQIIIFPYYVTDRNVIWYKK